MLVCEIWYIFEIHDSVLVHLYLIHVCTWGYDTYKGNQSWSYYLIVSTYFLIEEVR